jgi:acid phosphatase
MTQKAWSRPLAVIMMLFLLQSACSTDYYVHENVLGTLWIQTSAEYQMIAEQSYILARKSLDDGLEDANSTAALEQQAEFSHLPPAVILDIDETVLDNSPFHARLAQKDTDYNERMWEEWVLESRAAAVPGALEFVEYVESKGVTVIYITNRWHGLEEATRVNLMNLGFPIDDQLDVILTREGREYRDWDKSTRRKQVAEQYRIVLLVGDDLNDFVRADVSPNLRVEISERYREYWGTKWIVLPNPLDGSWVEALLNYDYDLTHSQKLERLERRLVSYE